MKPLVVVLLILFFGVNVYARGNILPEDEFRQLTPEQQIRHILQEWRYDLYGFGYYRKHEVILQENAEAVKPVILKYFKETEIPVQYKTEDRTFWILEYLTLSISGYLRWTPGERTEITELYREKIDWYLRVNKLVDFTIQKLEALMEGSNSGLWGAGAFLFLPEITSETLLKKYMDMGYEGLSLPAPEHQVKLFLADWKYERLYDNTKHGAQLSALIENAETVKPAILKCLEEIDIPKPYYLNPNTDNTFYLIYRLTTQDFRELWTLEERKELAEIYQAKIDWYLRTYKEVNGMIRMLEEIIEGMGSEGDIVYRGAPDVETLRKKYSGMGYEGLRVDRQRY
jgi:hypothetical protein